MQTEQLKQRLTSHQEQRKEVFAEEQRAKLKPWPRLDPEVHAYERVPCTLRLTDKTLPCRAGSACAGTASRCCR